MGLLPAMLQITEALFEQGQFRQFRSVVEIGSQDIMVPAADLAERLGALTGYVPQAGEAMTAQSFYGALGFDTYRCIDADGRHDALVFDLNEDLAEHYSYTEQFDFVTNHGTTEHVFDQRRAFENIHRLCVPGGLMLHSLPFQGLVNHGFFNYQPGFFCDLARANDYDIVGLYTNEDTSPELIACSPADGSSGVPQPAASARNLYLFAVLRKTTAEPFQVPYDGQFLASSQLGGEYEEQAPTAEREIRYSDVPNTWRPVIDADQLTGRQLLDMALRKLFAKVTRPLRRG